MTLAAVIPGLASRSIACTRLPPRFSTRKLLWMNSKYLSFDARTSGSSARIPSAAASAPRAGRLARARGRAPSRERSRTILELENALASCGRSGGVRPTRSEEERGTETAALLSAGRAIRRAPELLGGISRRAPRARRQDVSAGKLIHPLRLALTEGPSGPALRRARAPSAGAPCGGDRRFLPEHQSSGRGSPPPRLSSANARVDSSSRRVGAFRDGPLRSLRRRTAQVLIEIRAAGISPKRPLPEGFRTGAPAAAPGHEDRRSGRRERRGRVARRRRPHRHPPISSDAARADCCRSGEERFITPR